ncbi:MAG: heme-binding protein [Betaproteobacteria bacterium]|nr:heme-binding protein [Betaproteobacteria bacterium]
MRTAAMAAALVLAAATTTAHAQKRPDYGPDITVAAAKKIAAAALAECRKNEWNVAIAIVDTHGFLVYFERMENTQSASIEVAQGKAKVGAMYRRTTRVFAEVIAKSGPAVMTLPGVVASPGGLPIFADGKVIGGVGASGVTGDQDEQCAKAGLAGM